MELKFKTRVLLLIFYISGLHVIAILFFTRGFLLTRNELPLFSHCNDLHDNVGCNYTMLNVTALGNTFNTVPAVRENICELDRGYREPPRIASHLNSGNICWTPPAVKKIVILIFDALRFDFVAPSAIPEDKRRPWMDRLQVMQRLILEESTRARLFKFIADPPTTSLQRLKGLTTGSLPTFIDVGNSFGAPAIVEDNIISQLANNGKRMKMMGDDTWLALFPSQFHQAFPFPSFNVKDLHTVDNGVLEHLFPALHEDDWDVLIGHFLGVDHAGHIFGVESLQMVEKLDQYNKVVEDVISTLQNESACGRLHDDTLLLVMGDHGQTLNGDHGGGTAEEVETALLAWTTREQTHPLPDQCEPSSANNVGFRSSQEEQNKPIICDFQQLDFAVTLAAILGVPFPFGSIGKVNPELFGLVTGSLQPSKDTALNSSEVDCSAAEWLKLYSSILCLNCWQVNRYLQQYSKSSLNGFSISDLDILKNLYDDARSFSNEQSTTASSARVTMSSLLDAVSRYTKYLDAAAALARFKWTRFNDEFMAFGIAVLFVSLLIQLKAVRIFSVIPPMPVKIEDSYIFPLKEMIKSGYNFAVLSAGIFVLVYVFSGGSITVSAGQFVMILTGGIVIGTSKTYLFRRNLQTSKKIYKIIMRNVWREDLHSNFVGILAIIFSCIHACSLLSNSFILREQQVVTFFLVSLGIMDLRTALQQNSKVLQATWFLILNFILRILSEATLSKDMVLQSGDIKPGRPVSPYTSLLQQLSFSLLTVYAPLILVGYAFMTKLSRSYFPTRHLKAIQHLLPVTYAAICLYWLVEDLENLQLKAVPESIRLFVRLQIPRGIYLYASLALLGVLNAVVLLLLGRQGPLVAVISGLEAWCLLEKQSMYAPACESQRDDKAQIDYSSATVQWNLFSIQLFFCTGHRFSFDGLRYAAAFVGFDHFNIYRQGILLGLDTFGASHLLPIIGLQLLVSRRHVLRRNASDRFYKIQFSQTLLMFQLLCTVAATFITVCVAIQRRHLMVWGLFAPKFVFDAIGLLVTDFLLVLEFLYTTSPTLY
ncbi:hypothetical protein KP509_30G062700 [Ceratopteris richardii]|uniref:GPI ethanolamine phosphate transferase 2 C-terminal domain-containing protein n=1 Tax=Ceratopteris richardii TaxID=49495 RepID=A0A8T2R597_CERRI|nr:hypothetical protein KP509_30G062700 [Ceratopteris richardii]